MISIKELEVNKYLKEIEFLKYELRYKREVCSIYDLEFKKEIDKFLNKENNKEESIELYNDNEVINEAVIEETFDNNKEKSTIIKKLYREIVKLTHPDKVNNKFLNDIYILSTEYYNMDDIISIYEICSKLNIDYNIEDIDITELKRKIVSTKSIIKFMETTYSWLWYNSEDEEYKLNIIKSYLDNLQSN